MNARIGHQICLKFTQIHIQSTIKAKRSSDGRHDLTNETVKVGVGRSLDVEVATADIVNGLDVDHEGTVRVLKGSVSGEDRVVRLYYSCGDLWSRVDGKLQLGLPAVVNGEAFHQQGCEARAGTTTEAVEDEETLKTCA